MEEKVYLEKQTQCMANVIHKKKKKDADLKNTQAKNFSLEHKNSISLSQRGRGTNLTNQEVMDIFNDPRSQHAIANDLGIGRGVVEISSRRVTFAWLTEKQPNNKSNRKLIPPQVIQIYTDKRKFRPLHKILA